jgi:hypothetical protein
MTAADDNLEDYRERNAQYLTDAPTDAVCVMDWDRCTEVFCMRYASGCPHFSEQIDKRQALADSMKRATVRLYPEG